MSRTEPAPRPPTPETDDELLEGLQRDTFQYFVHEVNPANGLIADKACRERPELRERWPASIAAVGLALACYPVAVERGLLGRPEAVERTLTTLRFFWTSPQGPAPDATGHRGFYYHFLDMATGRRAGGCELSTVDSALFLAGALAAGLYFDRDDGAEHEVRTLADRLYRRADWRWAQNGAATVTHGWTPEGGFLPYRWRGYDEALLLYVLGLGSPTHPLPDESYAAWCESYRWREVHGVEYLHAGPLFIHQLPHVWIDFRGIRDGFMRGHGIDYFENSRRATHVQQRHAVANPGGFVGYGEHSWGITASDGPGGTTRVVDGVERRFFDYVARGVPDGPEDGTLSPWVAVASLPFAPGIVLPTIRAFDRMHLRDRHPYGYKATFNPTFPDEGAVDGRGWVSPWHFGINEGPIVAMIENHRTELLWRLMRRCPYVVGGLRRAGFTGGWL
jgi:hypothetical protein